MTLIEAARLALGELSKIAVAMPYPVGRNAITALQTAIEQAEKQEPVGMVKELFTIAAWERLDVVGSTKVYLGTPPAAQRQWVGFTEEEINEYDYEHRDFIYDIEALLKHKNTRLG